MKCLLVTATYEEIAPFIDFFRNEKFGWSRKLELDILVTGIGLTGTTYAISRQIYLTRPQMVIQAGIAGTLDRKMKPGNVVVIESERIADEMVMEEGKMLTPEDLGLRKPNRAPYKKGWLKNPHKELLKMTGLPIVRGISVNQVTTDRKQIRHYRKKFEAVAESMEGAALHFVCLAEQIPFLQLRGISNEVGVRDKSKWKVGKSVRNLNKKLIQLLDKLFPADQNNKS